MIETKVKVSYRKGYQPRIRRVNTRKLVFVALTRDKNLPVIQDFDDEFATIEKPANESHK